MLDFRLRMARDMASIRCHAFTVSAILLAGLVFVSPAFAESQKQGDAPSSQQPLSPEASSASQSSSTSPAPTGKKRLFKDFTLNGDTAWLDTGIDLQPGERIAVTAKGTLRYADAKTDNGPDGLTRGFKDLLRVLPFNGSGRGALIGLIGDADTSQPFLLGASHDSVSPIAGRLRFGINQSTSDTGDGSYNVHINVFAADSSFGAAQPIAKQVD